MVKTSIILRIVINVLKIIVVLIFQDFIVNVATNQKLLQIFIRGRNVNSIVLAKLTMMALVKVAH